MASRTVDGRPERMPRLFDPDGGEVRFGAWKVTPRHWELDTFSGIRHGLIGYGFDVFDVVDADPTCVGRKGMWLCRERFLHPYESSVWPVLFVKCDLTSGIIEVRTNGAPMDFSDGADHIDRIVEWEATVMADPAAAPAYADWLEENDVAPWRMHRLRGTVGVKS